MQCGGEGGGGEGWDVRQKERWDAKGGSKKLGAKGGGGGDGGRAKEWEGVGGRESR